MNLHVQIDGSTTPAQFRALANLYLTLSGDVGNTSVSGGVSGRSESGDAGDPEPAPAPRKARAEAKPKANGKGKPKPEPEVEAEEEEEEEDGVDLQKLRLEIRARFAAYVEEAGVNDGKALLDEFNADKFSAVEDSQLKQFAQRLTALEAEL